MKKIWLALSVMVVGSIKTESELQSKQPRYKETIMHEQFDLSDFEINFNEQEEAEMRALMEEDAKPPSQLKVYARQIGVVLLFAYIDTKEYYSSCWQCLKDLITKKKTISIKWF